MARTLGLTLLNHLHQPTTRLVTCWKITSAVTGEVLGFTNHVETLTISSVDYEPSMGIAPTTTHAKVGASVDNMDIKAVLDSSAITEADLLAGVWDFAAVEVFLVSSLDTAAGTVLLHKGTIGEVKSGDGLFTAEIRSLLQAAQQQIVALTTPSCRVRVLGDSECGVTLTTFTKTGTINVVTNNRSFTVSGAASGQANHYFRYGTILFTSGLNNGRSMEIKDNTGSSITLQEPMPFTVANGDSVTLIAGCDRSRDTCRDKFANIVNFRGEPDIPGNDAQQRKATAA